MRKTKILWAILGLVLVLLAVGGFWAIRAGKSIAGKGGSLVEVGQAISNPKALFPGQDRLTILVLGRDYDRDRKGMPYSKVSRADTIMILSVNLETKRLAAVSIPRDTKTTAPDGITGKINGVLARGGVELMKTTLMERFGVFVDYHVLLKADAVKELVDELGGVTVETMDEMHYDDAWGQLHIHLPKGVVKLDGKQAVGYVRFREPGAKFRKRTRNLEAGDLRRTARQQQMIQAMIASATSAGNLWKIDKLIETGFNQIETTMSRTQVVALANLLKGAREQMVSATLPGEDKTEDGAYYWVLDEGRSLNTIDWLIRGDQLAGRAVAKVAVYNATKLTGASKALASQLYTEGYDAFSAGTAKETLKATEVLFHRALHEQHAQQIAQIIGASVAKKEPIDPRNVWGPDISVRIGPDLAQQVIDRQSQLTLP